MFRTMFLLLFFTFSFIAAEDTSGITETLSDTPIQQNQRSASDSLQAPSIPQLPSPVPEAPAQQFLPPASGSLHVVTRSDKAAIYLDGKMVGTGSCMIEKVPLGQHEIYVTENDDSKSATVFVVENVTRRVDVSMKRELSVNVTSSFSQIFSHGINSYGPSLDVGIQHRKSYFGINFHWDFLSEWDDNWESSSGDQATCFGGAVFQYYYTAFEVPDIFELSAGFGAGFWYFNGYNHSGVSDNPYYPDGTWDYVEELFFGGPSLRAGIGYKMIFFNVGGTFLIGTRVGGLLTLGINLKL